MESEPLPSPDSTHTWAVIHTRPRCEKKIEEYCASKRIYNYLPKLRKKHRYGARLRTTEIPLFAGYLFVLASVAEKAVLRQNNRVANVLEVVDQAILLNQLINIKRALDSHETVELFPHLAAGMKVMVRSGPLKGVEGFIHKLKTKTRIVLHIDFIQKAVSIEIDAELLAPV